MLKLLIVQTFLALLRCTVEGNTIESMCHRGHTYPISTIRAIYTVPFRGVQMTQFVSSTLTPLIAGYSRVSQRTVLGNLCSSECSVVSEPTWSWAKFQGLHCPDVWQVFAHLIKCAFFSNLEHIQNQMGAV